MDTHTQHPHTHTSLTHTHTHIHTTHTYTHTYTYTHIQHITQHTPHTTADIIRDTQYIGRTNV